MKWLRLFVLLGALTVPGWAEDGDAPDQGVARIRVLNGDVTVRRGDSGEFVAAELNVPLVSLDHVLTDEKSRAEIQLDWANFVRVAPESEVRLAELKDRDFLIQVSSGTATFRVLEDTESRLEISTPNLAIRPRRHGVYRVTVWDDSTEVTVRAGEAEIFTGGKTDVLRSGLTLVVSGDPSDPQVSYQSAIPHDEWDRWNEARDRD
ncbi:MAG TPA: FecR domain-containing protein, partial [Terriglobia bacterium]|nr:FecR domain-containing protein [Terriglobia bacterium]